MSGSRVTVSYREDSHGAAIGHRVQVHLAAEPREPLALREMVQVSKSTSDTPWLYEVVGLPPEHDVFIRKLGNHWKVLRMRDGVRTSWSEGYASPEGALATVEAEWDL